MRPHRQHIGSAPRRCRLRRPAHRGCGGVYPASLTANNHVHLFTTARRERAGSPFYNYKNPPIQDRDNRIGPALTAIPELADLASIEGDLELRTNDGLTDLDDLPAVTKVGGRLAVVYHPELLQSDAEAWAAPIDAAERKIVGNKGHDPQTLDPCPWIDDGECDHSICIDDGYDCLSD